MAKKKTSKRANISAETLERARAELRGEKIATAEAAAVTASGGKPVVKAKNARPVTNFASRRIPTAEELKAYYAYVMKDLRNLVLLAGLLFAFIIAAAIVMPSLGI